VNIGGEASPSYKTAERIDNTTWGTYEGPTGGIMGTPKAINSLLEIPSEEGGVEDEEEEEETEDPTEDPEEEVIAEEVDEPTLSLKIESIIFDVDGADEGNERVAIMNNGTSTVALETYSIQYLKLGGDFSGINKKNFESGAVIEDVFTIGMNCSASVPCEGVDMSWSQALGNDGGTVYIVLNQEALESESDTDIHDSLSYSTPVAEEP
jgi:hypothetical protein